MSLFYSENKDNSWSSRYNPLRVITETGVGYSVRYLETYNDVSIPVREDDLYHIVEAKEEGRLDMISNKYYNTPTYWWCIALANNYIDPFAVRQGTIVRIPSLAEVSDISNEILTRRGQ